LLFHLSFFVSFSYLIYLLNILTIITYKTFYLGVTL